MGLGYLIVQTRTNFETLPVVDAHVTIKNANGEILYTLATDMDGITEKTSLETVDRQYSLDPNYQGDPYTSYDIEVSADGYETVYIHGVHIFDGETAIQPVTMIPMLSSETTPAQFNINIGKFAVQMYTPRHQEGVTPMIEPRVLRNVIIPNTITVHLGRPDIAAQNVRVPFIDYVKNVASHEIYATWPESSLRANIHVIVTFALNRVFTEWYRSRGYAFDISNSTAFDQYFVYGGTIYQSISRIVDEIFNQYVRRAGQFAPFFTSFCNGTTATCAGLSQWGTVSLANAGRTPIQILRYYYPNDIEIVESNIFADVPTTYPGSPLSIGSTGLNVQIIQTYLNRIRRNFPAIPAIANANGVFGEDTANAVRAFQRTFDLSQTGIVDKNTWYKISYIYVAVARLAELDSEGSTFGIGTVPPNIVLRQGSTGGEVILLQYILDYIAQFYPVIGPPVMDGVFGPGTAASVRDFQRMMNMTQDGVVGPATWAALYDTYWGIRNNTGITPQPPPGNYFNYTVVSGDTLWLLAQRFGTTVDAIKTLNGLTSDVLNIGQVLKIPGAGTTPTPPPPGNYFNYTVRSGDTLWLMAQRFGTTVAAIKALNNLASDALSIGQVLKIPGSFFQYTVVSGDTLWLLAQRFGTTVAAIKALNNLASDSLSIGQILLIPGT